MHVAWNYHISLEGECSRLTQVWTWESTHLGLGLVALKVKIGFISHYWVWQALTTNPLCSKIQKNGLYWQIYIFTLEIDMIGKLFFCNGLWQLSRQSNGSFVAIYPSNFDLFDLLKNKEVSKRNVPIWYI